MLPADAGAEEVNDALMARLRAAFPAILQGAIRSLT
jgi:hypothetical protein